MDACLRKFTLTVEIRRLCSSSRFSHTQDEVSVFRRADRWLCPEVSKQVLLGLGMLIMDYGNDGDGGWLLGGIEH